jgi:hypothetical protein
MNTISFGEAKEEAERLSRMLKRDVEVAPVTCDCDYSDACGKCGGEGLYYELRFAFCNHVVQDSNNDECEASDCQWREYQAFCCAGRERRGKTTPVYS